MRGYYGIGIFHGKTEQNIGTLWRHASLFGADFIFTIGARYRRQASDTAKTYRHVPLYHYRDYDDFHEHIPYGAQVLCVEQAQKVELLPDVTHPERCIYLLGAEDHGLPPSILEGKRVIEIPSPGEISMNVATAGTLVMYDRYLKLGRD